MGKPRTRDAKSHGQGENNQADLAQVESKTFGDHLVVHVFALLADDMSMPPRTTIGTDLLIQGRTGTRPGFMYKYPVVKPADTGSSAATAPPTRRGRTNPPCSKPHMRASPLQDSAGGRNRSIAASRPKIETPARAEPMVISTAHSTKPAAPSVRANTIPKNGHHPSTGCREAESHHLMLQRECCGCCDRKRFRYLYCAPCGPESLFKRPQ